MPIKSPEDVDPHMYYIWTWKPKNYSNRKRLANYDKHYCAVPFFTRYHARRTAEIHFGSEVLLHIRVISGKGLIAKGITKFPLRNHLRNRIFYKGVPRGMPKWITPPEYVMTLTRRLHWRRQLKYNAQRGRKYFNYFYALHLYGYTQVLSKEYIHYQRRELAYKVLQDLQKTGDI